MECRSRHRVDYDFILYDILTSDFFALLWNQRGSLNIPTLSRVLCSFCKWKWDNNIKWNLPPVFSWNVHLSSTVFLLCLSQSESNNQPMKRCVTFHFSICTKIWLDEDTLPWSDHVILLGQGLGIHFYFRHRQILCKTFHNNYYRFPHHKILFQLCMHREKHDLRRSTGLLYIEMFSDLYEINNTLNCKITIILYNIFYNLNV